MNGKTLGSIAVLIVIIGGWYLLRPAPASAPTAATTEAPAATAPTVTTTAVPATGVTVTYTDQGFSPKSVTVPLGTTVTFVNQSTGGMWVGSAKHPSHTVYSGTDLSAHCPDTSGTAFDECAAATPGSSYSFTFGKVGTWGYHNHVKSSDFGGVTVTAATTTP